ncbi:PDT-domain-containing protein [Nadsonia fulvescens var. elongata DSM 6958]|uniref:prephenate dehydratase n=1 Tax=Nadsonia fulvescens var. elongata DSM 6958 TaxID=857566 RepID=A0A1E3PFT2_9ASCO|nr:PDT-domain-containing protein [Nadsonia fulvescens var. elongata DSM 6958]
MSKSSIAFLGPFGTYSHEAAVRFSKTLNDNTEKVFIPISSIADCIGTLDEDKVQYAVVPLENSTNGSVIFTLDIIRERYHSRPSSTGSDSVSSLSSESEHEDIIPSYSAVAEVYVPIHHCLMTTGPSDLSQVKRVYSHPQVWGQCDIWFNKHMKGVEKIDTASTSQAAEFAAKDPSSAAIASLSASDVHSVPIVQANIENITDNTTRFLVFAKDEYYRTQPTGNDLTLLSFTIKNSVSGSLCEALEAFKQQNLNLCAISSRPSLIQPWNYLFYVEFGGHRDQENVVKVVKSLTETCLVVRVIGSFPRALPVNSNYN